jgi:biopolymer transport protein ExbB
MAGMPLAEISPLGWAVLGALAALSVFAATLVLAKLVQFRRARLGDTRPAEQAMQLWSAGERGAALTTVAAAAGPRAALLRELFAALAAHPGDIAGAQARGAQRAIEDLAALERNMRGIEAVVQAAPMLGLLGTVIGMIEAFGRLAQSTGAADPAELAGGIWTALITTALGLAIAILFYFLSLWLEARVARERAALESLLAAVPGALAAPAPAAGRG